MRLRPWYNRSGNIQGVSWPDGRKALLVPGCRTWDKALARLRSGDFTRLIPAHGGWVGDLQPTLALHVEAGER